MGDAINKFFKLLPFITVVALFIAFLFSRDIRWSNKEVHGLLLGLLVLLCINIASFKVALLEKDKNKGLYILLMGVFLVTTLFIVFSLVKISLIGHPW